jgi:cobalt-zinc-cadmium efflux system outer membrane protein
MRYSKLPVTRAMLVLFLLFALDAAALGSSDIEKSANAITLQEAISRALANNPGIKAAKIDVDIEKARQTFGALPTPITFDAEIENFAGTDSFSGVDSAETTLQLAKVFELGDKQQYRVEVGDAQVDLSRLNATIRELDLTSKVSRRFADLLKRQAQIEIVSESVEISRRTLEIVQRRVAVGRASEAEQSSAAVALSRIKLIENRLQYEIAASRVNLSTLFGVANPDFSTVAGDIESLPALPAYSDMESSLTDNPEIRRIATISRVLNAKRRLAESKRRPDLALSAGVRHLSATDDMAMVLSFNMPFGSSGRADSLVHASDMQLAKLPVTQSEQLLELQAALFGFYQTLLATHSEFEILRDEIIPEAELAVQFYERGFERGSYSLLELTAAQERLLSLRSEVLEAAASFHVTLIEIESLLGSTRPGGALQ